MPTQSKLPYLTGKLTDAQREKMTQFLDTSGVPDGVGQILFLNPVQMQQMKTMRRITDEHPGFSDLNQGRVFVPDTVLDNPALAQDLLLHEFGHFDANSADENKAEQAAKVRRTVYGAKSRASKVVGQFEPTRAPLGTQLVPPQSSAVPSSTPAPTPAPPSQPGGLLSLARIGAHIPAAALGALGAAARRV